jgi:hypothetical protein
MADEQQQELSRQRLRDAAAARKRTKQRRRKLAIEQNQLVLEEREAIKAAVKAGVRQVDIANDVERSREHIRLVMKGIADDNS